MGPGDSPAWGSIDFYLADFSLHNAILAIQLTVQKSNA